MKMSKAWFKQFGSIALALALDGFRWSFEEFFNEFVLAVDMYLLVCIEV